jgi:hypothetical protein
VPDSADRSVRRSEGLGGASQLGEVDLRKSTRRMGRAGQIGPKVTLDLGSSITPESARSPPPGSPLKKPEDRRSGGDAENQGEIHHPSLRNGPGGRFTPALASAGRMESH